MRRWLSYIAASNGSRRASRPLRDTPGLAAGSGRFGGPGRLRGGTTAAGRTVFFAVEGLAVGQHGVDLPRLSVRRALDPELVLLRVAAGGVALINIGQPGLSQAGLHRVDRVDVGDLDAEVVEAAALAGVFQQDQ